MWIRAAVIRILGARGGPDVAQTLLPILNDPVGMIQIAVCEALGTLRVREGTGPLITLLDSADHDVKQAAVVALGEIGGAGVGERVAPLLSDAHWGVRAAAAVALGLLSSGVVLASGISGGLVFLLWKVHVPAAENADPQRAAGGRG